MGTGPGCGPNLPFGHALVLVLLAAAAGMGAGRLMAEVIDPATSRWVWWAAAPVWLALEIAMEFAVGILGYRSGRARTVAAVALLAGLYGALFRYST